MSGTPSQAVEIDGSYIEFQAAVLRQLPRPEEIDKTTRKEWTDNQGGLKSFLAGLNPPVQKRKLLESVGRFHTLGTTKFVAAEHFKVDTSRKAKVKTAFLWDNFANNFVPKVEENVPAGELKVHKLLESSLDAPIIAELGDNHETYLSDFWALLEKQPGGENGLLLTNGYANIFYIRDASGKLWAVGAHWRSDDGGWSLGACSVSDPLRWDAGGQVVSR